MASKKPNHIDDLVVVNIKLPSCVRSALNNHCETNHVTQGSVVTDALERYLLGAAKQEKANVDDVERRLWVLSQRLRQLEPSESSPSDSLLEVAAGLDKRVAEVESKLDDSQVKTLQAEVTRLQTANAKLTRQLSALLAVESASDHVEAAAS